MVYFSNINEKINYLSCLLICFKKKKICFVDFDTVFSSYIQNNILNYDLDIFSDIKLILPKEYNIENIFVKVINSMNDDSLVILDSLNGLIDFLNIMNLLERKGNKKTILKEKHVRYRFASYQSFNILFLLLKKIEKTKIPIIVTKYQPLERSKKMMLDLLDSNDFETNHFTRISNIILFLEFIEKEYKTCFTLLKKGCSSPCYSNIRSSSLPISIKTLKERNEYFAPYSKWYYFNFFDI